MKTITSASHFRVYCLCFFLVVSVQVSGQTILFSEDFEGQSYSFTSSGNPGWLQNSFLSSGNGFKSVRSTIDANSSLSYLTSDPINCSGSGSVYLSFYHICKNEFFDAATIEYSLNGTTWQAINGVNSGDWTLIFGTEHFSAQGYKFSDFSYIDWQPGSSSNPTNAWWKREVFEITNLAAGQSSFQVRFVLDEVNGNYGNSTQRFGWVIDDVTVSDYICDVNQTSVNYDLLVSSNVYTPGPYSIEVTVNDDDGIQDVYLFYSIDGGISFVQNSMVPVNVSGNGTGTYSFDIPAVALNTTVVYYVATLDNSYCPAAFTSEYQSFIYTEEAISFCDDPSYPLANNIDCNNPAPICYTNYIKHNFIPGATVPILYFSFVVPPGQTNTVPQLISFNANNGYELADVRLYGEYECGEFDGEVCYGNANHETPTQSSPTAFAYLYEFNTSLPLDPGYYILTVQANQFAGCFVIQWGHGGNVLCHCTEEPCINCIGSFAPEGGKEYMLSAWVKEDNWTPSTINYTDSKISIDFNPGSIYGPYSPKGLVIDGWQRIEEKVLIPLGAVEMDLILESPANHDAYFDDIRMYPVDGSMKSYVYDPITKLFVAELDENNYATFYEYDEEGKLTRVKKETERGIMTIKEHRNNNPK